MVGTDVAAEGVELVVDLRVTVARLTGRPPPRPRLAPR